MKHEDETSFFLQWSETKLRTKRLVCCCYIRKIVGTHEGGWRFLCAPSWLLEIWNISAAYGCMCFADLSLWLFCVMRHDYIATSVDPGWSHLSHKYSTKANCIPQINKSNIYDNYLPVSNFVIAWMIKM